MYDGNKNGNDMVGDFQRSCPNVRSLSVKETRSLWASTFARQLEKLEVESNGIQDLFPSICPDLLELNIDTGNPFFDSNSIDWNNVGSKLESLRIEQMVNSQDVLKNIRKHCESLKHIDIHMTCYFSEPPLFIAEFIASYGDQLEHVHVHNMTEDQLNLIAGRCRNARFYVYICENDKLLLSATRILATRLVKISIIFRRKYTDSNSFFSWRSNVNDSAHPVCL